MQFSCDLDVFMKGYELKSFYSAVISTVPQEDSNESSSNFIIL